jgi:hypothetical protein
LWTHGHPVGASLQSLAFQAPWNAPTFWIKESGTTAIQIPNVSSTPGVNSTWYNSVGGSFYNSNRTHSIALVFPAGIDKAVTYSGVTIWIQARND